MDEAAREEAYLNKMMNKHKDTTAVKKQVFGGGLEAARAKQNDPPRKGSLNTGGSYGYQGLPVQAEQPRGRAGPGAGVGGARGNAFPPTLECEVVEMDLPLPPPKAYVNSNPPPPPPQQEDNFVAKTLGEDAARKEEERMQKSIGRFAAPKSVLTPGVQAPPPTTYTIPPAYTAFSPSHVINPPPAPSYHQNPHHQNISNQNPVHQNPVHQNPVYQNPVHQNVGSGGNYGGSKNSAQNFNFDTSAPMQVGNITPSQDPTANFLPITSVAVPLQNIHISVYKNGKNLQIKRTISDKIETKSLNLPYQVTPHTVAATYYPGKSNGELSIKLGKNLPRSNNAEYEVTRFNVPGSPGSTVERVQINVAQESDHFVFSPGTPSAYETAFTVVVVGSSLEFRSVYSFQEGNAVKTVNGKQVISLAIPPTLQQIDIHGDVITVWPNRGTAGAEMEIADFDVNVILG